MTFRNVVQIMLAVVLVGFSVGCSTNETTRTWVDLAEVSSQVEKKDFLDPVLEDGSDLTLQPKSARVKDMGTDSDDFQDSSLPGKRPGAIEPKKKDGEEGILLNFDNADIFEFIQVMSEALGINYIVDPQVKGVVTIRSARSIKNDQLYDVFGKILNINGLDFRNEGEYYYIYPTKGKAAPQKLLSLSQVDNLKPSSRLVLQVIPVAHLASAEAAKLIEQYLSPAGSLHNLTGQNTLLIHDYESKVIDALSVLRRLDISPLAALKIRLVRVENAPLFEVREELSEVMSVLTVNSKEYDGVSIIPLERVNSLLLVSKSTRLLDNADRWIRELDVVPSEGRDNIYFYNVRNSVASELASLVNSLIKDNLGGTASKPAGSVLKGSVPVKPPSRVAKLKGVAETSSLRFAGEPLLLPDDKRNIILIRALVPDYTRLVKLLERLDNMPRQVLIEVLVAEVKLTDSWEFGVEWALKNNQLKIDNSNYSQTVGTNFTAVATNAVGGLTYSILNSVGDVVGLINALASETDVSLLSSPQVLVLNNEQATVNVGDQVPIVTTETQQVGEATAVDKTVQYKDTGTILTVTPRINYNGVIILDIDQQVSQATETTSSTINSPTISTRKLKTKLAVKDGQSILMGGLISKNLTLNQNSVPILGDIPILGWLFKYEKEVETKTELLVMITPYVIESEDVLDQYIKKFQNKMGKLRKQLTAM